MEQATIVEPEKLWFNTLIPKVLCRMGNNGPKHPSQLYAIEKYVIPITKDWAVSFLDYGCGSATTYEAIQKKWPDLLGTALFYRGADIIPKNIEWCKENFPGGEWVLYDTDLIGEPDKSWDVVYSRHVVDHQKSFEFGLNEQCRVAKKLVIIVLWRPLLASDNHDIKNIFESGKTYLNEWTNAYSRRKVMEAVYEKEKDGWRLEEIAEAVGHEVKGWDTVIVLSRKDGPKTD